ncbi:SAM-dependent DNA methyltransferase [Azospirillum tabaci]|uniref:SAM-dependent DNA methyltransferase n=1 Tax=Azospirillum tabaci TaxID=2752310 RepID=UPI001B3B972D|nr:SAM-dependent DNA methyltransferase [Azospirillum tabaci]
MSQNRSHAVMAQRAEPRDSLDDFPTPPWGTRALCVHTLPQLGITQEGMANLEVHEPAANRGHMVRALRESFGTVHASDVHDYGTGFEVDDFLLPGLASRRADLIITNPPFRLATAFVRRAMQVSRFGCAVLVRGTWMESNERYQLFSETPPTLIAQFVERLPMIEGYVAREASSATAYAWVIFLHGQTDTRWRHIPPCRRQLERADDYPEWAEQARLLSEGQLGRLLGRYVLEGPKPIMPEAVILAELDRRCGAPRSMATAAGPVEFELEPRNHSTQGEV